MKRPVLSICGKCSSGADDAAGETLFRAVKKERKKRELKALFKLEEVGCLDRCDTPCNAELRGKRNPTLQLTQLDAKRDAVPLLEAMVRYAKAEDAPTHQSLALPGRPA